MQKSERKGLKHILADPKARSDVVVAEIEADAARYADARRAVIEAVAPVAASRSVPDKPITVTLSRNGWMRSRQCHGLDVAQFAWKTGDAPLAILETRTVDGVVVLDTMGRAYTMRATCCTARVRAPRRAEGRGYGVRAGAVIVGEAGSGKSGLRVVEVAAGIGATAGCLTSGNNGGGGTGRPRSRDRPRARCRARSIHECPVTGGTRHLGASPIREMRTR